MLARDTTLATGPSALRARHAELVERMAKAGRKIAAEKAAEVNGAKKQSRRFFAPVFTPNRPMPTLHMHLVSSDLRGSGMKTRRHWNTFATDFFKEADDVVAARARAGGWTGTRRRRKPGWRWRNSGATDAGTVLSRRCPSCSRTSTSANGRSSRNE